MTRYVKLKPMPREILLDESEDSEPLIYPHGFRMNDIRSLLDHSDLHPAVYLAFAIPPTTSVH